MKLKVERLNHTAEGIAIKDNIVYFIKKTIPNDIIEVEEKDIINHKNYKEVIKYKLINKSKERIPINCPYYKECGGCQLMELPYKKQLEFKQEKVIDIFKKYANLTINPTIIKTTPKEYRNKITLQVEKGILGLYQENTHKIIPIKKCLLIPNKLNKLIEPLSNLNLTKINKIILRIIENEIMIQFIGTITKEEALILKDKVSSIYINNTKIIGKDHLIENLNNYKFYISPTSFFQINKEGTLLIYNKVKEYLGKNNNNVLDLYCGTGTIGIYISKYCKKITGIELNTSSVTDALKNIKINKTNNINIIKGDVGETLNSNNKYDTIIIDPPRSGLNKKTLNTLLEIKSPKIIYISCNPITLARDINILKEQYNLTEITLVDMFPNTYHVETVMVLEKKDV